MGSHHSALVVYSDHVSPWVHEIYKLCIPHLKMKKRLSNDRGKKIRETYTRGGESNRLQYRR